MIGRCYSEKNKAYYEKVKVCERWKTFEYFYEDIPLIDNWSEEQFINKKIALDKDIKQRFLKNKIYSVETCTWVLSSENACIQDGQQRIFIGIEPNGSKYISTNITRFARENNLERRQISAVLHKRFQTTQGWKFYYLNDIDKEIV